MFEWVKGNAYTMLVTLYPNNFTLNNVAAAYFDDIRWCCIGVDRVNRKVAIRPVTKREVDLKLVPLEQLHKVSMGKGYARISNKALIEEIASVMGRECSGVKVPAHFDDSEKMLILDLNNPL